MKKITLFLLSTMLVFSISAIGMDDISNESETKVVQSTVDKVDIDFFSTMDELPNLIKRTNKEYMVGIDVSLENRQYIMAYSVGFYENQTMYFTDTGIIRTKESRQGRIKLNENIKSLAEFYNTEPMVSGLNHSISCGGRTLGKTARGELYKHVLQFKDGKLCNDYFQKT